MSQSGPKDGPPDAQCTTQVPRRPVSCKAIARHFRGTAFISASGPYDRLTSCKSSPCLSLPGPPANPRNARWSVGLAPAGCLECRNRATVVIRPGCYRIRKRAGLRDDGCAQACHRHAARPGRRQMAAIRGAATFLDSRASSDAILPGCCPELRIVPGMASGCHISRTGLLRYAMDRHAKTNRNAP